MEDRGTIKKLSWPITFSVHHRIDQKTTREQTGILFLQGRMGQLVANDGNQMILYACTKEKSVSSKAL